jgi:site-specific recombinase XerD
VVSLSKKRRLIMDVRKSIQQLVSGVLSELKKKGYSRYTVKKYHAVYMSLLTYADHNGIQEYSEAVGLGFMDFKFGFKLEDFFGKLPENVSMTLHHLMILWHYRQYGTVEFIARGKKKPFVCPACFQKEYNAFLGYCEQKKYTILGLRAILNPVRRLLAFLDTSRVLHIDDINPAYLSAFIFIYIDDSQRYVATIISALRTFFKCLHNEGYLRKETWDMLPKVKHTRNPFIPPSWKKEDVFKLLKAVDRGNPLGKRDYAILLLVVRLGLRASDIRNLRLSSLDWNRKKITIVQTKTKQTLEPPILDDIGWALIDYLKNGRPKTKATTVFVNHRAPHGEFKDTNGMQHILWKYMRFAGLEIPKNEHCGLHSLRSTLARTMLESGTPLPVISEVLGHESVQTTSIYLKINIDALRKCAIDPEEVFQYEG